MSQPESPTARIAVPDLAVPDLAAPDLAAPDIAASGIAAAELGAAEIAALEAGAEPSEELRRLVQLLGMRSRDHFDLPTFRDDFERFSKLFPPPPEIARSEVEVGGVRCARFVPAAATAGRVVVYLHGGGYVSGSITTHGELAAKLARASAATVYLVDYRLAPEAVFPAPLDDTLAVIRALRRHGAVERLALAGDSAGGGLALAALVALRDAGEATAGAAVCLSPWVDLEAGSASITARAHLDKLLQPRMLTTIAGLYLAGTSPRHPLVSPIHADLAGLPPLLIQVGTAEILLDDALRLARRAREHGVAVELVVEPHLIHVWHLFSSLLPEAERSIAEAGAFLARHLS